MSYEPDNEMPSRVVHYFRNVDLLSKSVPQFAPDHFSGNCYVEDSSWPALFLLRVALRHHHIWATFGIRDGKATIYGSRPAVCFSSFSVADLIAAKAQFVKRDKNITPYAISFPIDSAAKEGAKRVIRGVDLDGCLQAENGDSKTHTQDDISQNLFRYIDSQADSNCDQDGLDEWRWPYSNNYRRAIAKIEADGIENNPIPGLNLIQKQWAGVGIVVASHSDALRIRYDILALIDQKVVAEDHFDHVLVCDELPESLDGLSETDISVAFSSACFDFKSCMSVSIDKASAVLEDFKHRLSGLELSTPKGQVYEDGGCWITFEDNTHPYVRGLIASGRVIVNKLGRYLGTLDELDGHRDLRERQKIVTALCMQLRTEHNLICSYYSVLRSWLPDGLPSFTKELWGSFYRITDEPDEKDTPEHNP